MDDTLDFHLLNDFQRDFPLWKNFENVDRAIFGYLCLDHVDTNYFTEQDAKVGYMYADLLSVFMFVRMMYTEMFGYLQEDHQGGKRG